MSEPVHNEIVLLVERLREDNELEVSEVQQRLAAYPGWSQWANLILMDGKHYGPSTVTLITGTQVGAPGLVPARTRQALLNTLLPYALLLDSRHPPAERAIMLKQAGIEVENFCKECFHNEDQEIKTAAYVVLTEYEMRLDLLRGSSRPEDLAAELLRPPTAPTSAENLLRAADSARADTPQPGWLQRLWKLLSGKSGGH